MSNKKSSSSPLRFLLFAVLLVGVVFLILDRNARSSSQSFHNSLTKALEDGKPLKDSDVAKLAGRAPVASDVNNERKTAYDEFVWSSGLRSYNVIAYYSIGAAKLLNQTTINKPLGSEWKK